MNNIGVRGGGMNDGIVNMRTTVGMDNGMDDNRTLMGIVDGMIDIYGHTRGIVKESMPFRTCQFKILEFFCKEREASGMEGYCRLFLHLNLSIPNGLGEVN